MYYTTKQFKYLKPTNKKVMDGKLAKEMLPKISLFIFLFYIYF